MYIRNANSSQRYLSETANNYINITSSASHYVTGNWLALAPGARTSGTIEQYAFYRLFYNNTGLTSAPDFDYEVNGHFVGGANYAFSMMFYGCTHLTRTPSFKVDAEGRESIFSRTFQGCTVATSAGDIDMGYCGPYGLEYAYYNCTNLVHGPKISYNGYISQYGARGIFYGCSKLVDTGEIPIRTVDSYGLQQAFYNCTLFNGTGPTAVFESHYDNESMTTDWIGNIYLTGSYSLSECFYGCTSLAKAFGTYYNDSYLPVTKKNISFQFQGTSGSYRMYRTFKNSGLPQNALRCMYLGDVRNSGDKEWKTSDLEECFCGCTSITNASHIFKPDYWPFNLTSLRPGQFSGIFKNMFYGCTSLEYARLPESVSWGATGMMYGMFQGCTSLERVYGKTPSVSSSDMFRSMFEGCTSLVSSPVISNLPTPYGMTRMFYNCSALKYIITAQTGFGSSSSLTKDWTYGTTNGTTDVPRYFVNLNTSLNYDSDSMNASGNTTSGDTYRVPYNWTIINGPLYIEPESGTTNVRLYKYGSPSGTHTFNYLNLASGQTNTYTPSSSPTNIGSSVGILFWGTSTLTGSGRGLLSSSSSDYYRFGITGAQCSISGDIGSVAKSTGSGISPRQPNYAFYRMFYGCTAIKDASGLTGIDGSTAGSYWYSAMFEGCSNLVNAPSISVASDFEYTFYRMFYNCSLLAAPPSLSGCSSVTASSGTFAYMFYNCSSITEPAELPTVSQKQMEINLFNGMYRGCSSITQIPSGYLPWTESAASCYANMFYGCSSLSSVPSDLIAFSTLTSQCCANMFENCTSLETAPDLNATSTGATYAYSKMFAGCTSLSYIKVAFTAWTKADSTHRDTWDWTRGLPTTGHFWCPGTLPQNRNNSTNTGNSVTQSDGCTDTGASFIPYGWTIHSTSASSDFSDTANMLVFTRSSGTVTISPTANTSNKLQYTTNGITWAPFTSQFTLSTSGQKIGFRAASKLPVFSTSTRPFTFSGTGKFNVSGNVTRFFNTTQSDATNADCLFYACQNIGSCTGMYFSSSLITAKEMFMNSSVTSVDRNLLTTHYPAYESGNFYQMFRGCTSLTQGAHLYTAAAVYPLDFYNIYYGCTNLQSAASSPIEIGKPSSGATASGIFAPADEFYLKRHEGYYCAFYGCTSIAAAKVNFNYMGKDWNNTNLRRTFEGCFYGCSNLRTIWCKAVRWPLLECTNDWVYGVADTGTRTFYKYTGNSLGSQHGRDRIPQGWTVTETTWA